MKDSTKAILVALTQGKKDRLEAEVKKYTEKEQAINTAEGVIYSELGRWTGLDLKPGDPVPVVRDRKQVRLLPFEPNPVREILEAARIADRSEITKRLDRARSLEIATDELIKSLDKMTGMERAQFEVRGKPKEENGTNPTTWPLEARLIGEIGVVTSAVVAASKLNIEARREIKNLENELEKWASHLGRPRNRAAYEVARRLAVLYAKVTGKRPTYSEGPDGVSGEFTPALRSVFDALGWKKTVLKGPAKHAVAAVTEADLDHEKMGLLSLLSTLPRR